MQLKRGSITVDFHKLEMNLETQVLERDQRPFMLDSGAFLGKKWVGNRLDKHFWAQFTSCTACSDDLSYQLSVASQARDRTWAGILIGNGAQFREKFAFYEILKLLLKNQSPGYGRRDNSITIDPSQIEDSQAQKANVRSRVASSTVINIK